MTLNKHTYKVKIAKISLGENEIKSWVILKDNVLMYEPNMWLNDGEMKVKTAKRYAHALVVFFKYLDTLGIDFKDVTKKRIIRGYIFYLLHNTEDENLKSLSPLRSAVTINGYISIIQTFYRWYEGEIEDFNTPFKGLPTGDGRTSKKKPKAHRGFLYGQVWDTDFGQTVIKALKCKAKRNYRKWYEREDIDSIASNFKTLRDKAIFLISVEAGCRIDEILCLRYENYDSFERSIFVPESKTFPRKITIPRNLCDLIDSYILTERQIVESEVGICDYLFINLKKGKAKGEQLKYRNYYEILKRCARRAGFNPKEIITHSGRATRAQELIENQILHPDDGITDTLMCDVMGWSSIDSAKPYKKQFSLKIQRKIADKVVLRRRIKPVENDKEK